jgi:hypothetical protein
MVEGRTSELHGGWAMEGYGGRGAGFGEENGMHGGVEMEMGVGCFL